MRLTTATIISNMLVRPGVHLIEAHEPYLAQTSQPGQYCMVRCCDPAASDPLLRRPFFVQSIKRDRQRVSFLVAARGRGSAWLTRQTEGATLDILGPAGHGWEIGSVARNLLLIGEGEMIGSLTLLAQAAIEQELAVTLLCRFPSEQDIYPPALLSPEIEFHTVIAFDGDAALVERAGDFVTWADSVYCSLWPETMQALYRAYEPLRRVSAGGLSAQGLLLPPLVCANGVCLTCTHETRPGVKLVCRDGPVFPLGDIAEY